MRPRGMADGRLRRLIRRLRPDGNPLRRTADRLEAALAVFLIAGFLAGAPLAALAGGNWAAGATRAAQRAEASWHPVRATLLQSAAAATGSIFSLQPQVRARWSAPDGTSRTGEVYAPGGSKAGQAVTIWTDRSGHRVGYPLQHADVVLRSLLGGLAAVAALTAVLGLIGVAARALLNRRRLAAWDLGWAASGPEWSGRPQH
ncbi:MAG: hypothetical protein J2P34_03825 [Actinobacteria bacterium]|nr:hypothetical protein [Actinomycetota bacterium]